MKSITKITAVFLASLTLGTGLVTCVPVLTVNADTSVKKADIQGDISTDLLSESVINYADQYISVVNNQYVLNLPSNSDLSTDQIVAIKNTIAESNINIVTQGLVIDPITRIANIAIPVITPRAAYNKNFTYKNFWWGTRYYFTSNAAVEQLAHNFDQKAQTLMVGGIIGGVASAGSAVAVAGVGSLFFSKMASDLRYYNSTHIHNQIYMDLNMALSYSFHILK